MKSPSPHFPQLLFSEIESQTQPHAEWQVISDVQRCRLGSRLAEVGIDLSCSGLTELIIQSDPPVVRHIEEVSDEGHSYALSDPEGIVCVQIELREERRPAETASSPDWNLAGTEVDRMGQKFAERNAGFQAYSGAEIQSLDVPGESSLAQCIAPINVRYVAAFGVERADRELIAQQAELAGREVEE
jgi:hypothetical protein